MKCRGNGKSASRIVSKRLFLGNFLRHKFWLRSVFDSMNVFKIKCPCDRCSTPLTDLMYQIQYYIALKWIINSHFCHWTVCERWVIAHSTHTYFPTRLFSSVRFELWSDFHLLALECISASPDACFILFMRIRVLDALKLHWTPRFASQPNTWTHWASVCSRFVTLFEIGSNTGSGQKWYFTRNIKFDLFFLYTSLAHTLTFHFTLTLFFFPSFSCGSRNRWNNHFCGRIHIIASASGTEYLRFHNTDIVIIAIVWQ